MLHRSLLGCLIVTGCTFVRGAPSSPGDANSDVTSDVVDARVFLDAPGCPDTDNDTICNAVDKCPGFDDRLDADGDAIPDGCDDWPCGAKPAAPANMVTDDSVDGSGNHLTISLTATKMNGSARLVVAPSASVSYTTAYTIIDCICTGCIDQIEVGFVPGTRDSCAYDGNPQGNSVGNCSLPTSGTYSHSFIAPAVGGVYEMRFRLSQDNSCGSHNGWWLSTPPDPTETVALLCVH